MKILILLFLIISSPINAKQWVVNNDHSDVSFVISYMGISEVRGLFSDFNGSLEISEDEKISKILVSIKASSIFTGNRMRDGHLKGNDFLQVKENPLIVFQSEKTQSPRSGILITDGLLKIKKISRPIKIEFTISDLKTDTWGLKSRFVKFKTAINRKEFNITWNKTLDNQEFLLGDTINISGTFQIQPSGGETPSSKHMIPDTPYIRIRERIGRGEIVNPPKTNTTNSISAQITPLKTNKLKTNNFKKTSLKSGTRSFRWWTSLVTLGLFGFFGVIALGIYLKKMMLKSFNAHNENGLSSQLSDIPLIVLVFIYSVVLWEIGWG